MLERFFLWFISLIVFAVGGITFGVVAAYVIGLAADVHPGVERLMPTVQAVCVLGGMVVGVWSGHAMSKCEEANPRVCLRCGYNLTGNVTGRCPECGQRIPKRQLERLAEHRDP